MTSVMGGVEGFDELRSELGALQREVERLRKRVSVLEAENVELKRENRELRRLLEEERRKNKRQASPFSKGEPKESPEKPGRKPGGSYGKHSRRSIPKKIDRRESVPCPLWCEHCGGGVRLDHREKQYQTDIPPIEPETIEFTIEVGRCVRCGRAARGRHAEQLSETTGPVGGVQIGARAIALGTHLNKSCGMSWGRIASLFGQIFRLQVSRSALCRMMKRFGRHVEPVYQQLCARVRDAPRVSPDETGWRIGGRKGWLHTAVSSDTTIYKISRGRGYPEASALLGEKYKGTIVADGWAPYRRFTAAKRQSCIAHLMRRDRELARTPGSEQAQSWLAGINDVFKKALDLRDRRMRMSKHGFGVAHGRIEAAFDRLLDDPPLDDESLRFAAHLLRERDALFVFLADPKLDATNYRAEQAIRPAVVNRKMNGGNRTQSGAHAQAILMSVLRTSTQRGLDLFDTLITLLRTPSNQLNSAVTW